MTCFWDGCINGLKQYNFIENYISPKDFVEVLKENCVKTINVNWNSETLINKQLDENYYAIKTYNSNHINQGYDCSTCEPFLLLICELFRVNIEHDYCGSKIYYNYIGNPRKTLTFRSDRGHFWFV